MVRWAFDTLGIEVTKDKRVIKKAYSELVKKYHPEEYPDEWSEIHRAYQAAIEYAEEECRAEEEDQEEEEYREEDDDQEEEEYREEDDDQAEEILSDEDYDEMFAEAHAKWKEEKSEKTLALARRLNELIQTPAVFAEKEWQDFFAVEFLVGAEADELFMLYETISANEISLPAAEVITKTMRKRKEFYQASMEFNKAALADTIVNCICQKLPGVERGPVKQRKQRKGIRGILKELLAGAGIGALVLVILVFVTAGESSQNAKISEAAVRQLNEKYGEELYSEEDIEVEKDETYNASLGSLVCYKVTEKGSYDLIAYMLGRKEDEGGLLCFDKLQAADIKRALEEAVNERTGFPEGKLYWDSAGETARHIRDGYFHEKYDNSISGFLELEAKARETVAGTDYYAAEISSGKNGNVEYYVPDRKIRTVEQRLEAGEVAEDKEFSEALEQCAVDYEIQICGIVLPQVLFEERMKQTDWNEENMSVKSEVSSTRLYPPMPLSMITGWYVCVPPDGQGNYKVENGMYQGTFIDMAEGIRGVESNIRIQKGISKELGLPDDIELPELSGEADMTGCMERIDTPELPEIHKKIGRTAISFSLADGYKTEQDYCLTIAKEIYGIPDSGYQVMLTTYDSGDEAATEELELASYSDPGVNVTHGCVQDGEGYLFVEYPRSGDEKEAPVITILY